MTGMYQGKIINPATGEPFVQVAATPQIQQLRKQIIRKLRGPTGKYDAAQDTSQNEQHWVWADNLSPNSANSLAVRKKLRSRSRYEVANNGYLKGILLTLAGDFVGSGPSLQVTDRRFTEEQRRLIETTWVRRAKSIKLRGKLWQNRHAKCQDGESFNFAFSNPTLHHRVNLDYKVVECDQVSHYDYSTYQKKDRTSEIDGIRFSKRTGLPVSYHLLNVHPGETEIMTMEPLNGTWVPQRQVLHWFRRDRPYLRGIPETIASLPLWALLRRYTLAVVQNAEIAADFTVLLKSLQPPLATPFPLSGSPGEPTQASSDDWFDSFPIDRGLMTVLPDMYDMGQLDPKQPVTVYDDFVMALVQEAARPLLVPRNLALGYSGNANMSASTVDKQLYKSAVSQERLDCEDEVLDKDLGEWWFHAIRTPQYFDDENISAEDIKSTVARYNSLQAEPPEHVYRWDEIPEHTDPVKVATAINLLHEGGHLSDVDIQEGRFNRRVEDHYDNLERQIIRREEIGFTPDPAEEMNIQGRIPEDDDDE